MKIILVAGTRPNFVKIAPLMAQLELLKQSHASLEYLLVHTGQHYDSRLSDSFFSDLKIPEPSYHLEVGSGSHTFQTATIMLRFEEVLLKEKPDWVLVVGDVNSTVACALVTKKMGAKLAHVEGGLRSFDLEMPEEINRMVTDAITDVFFTTSEIANVNLRREGHQEHKIQFVGNTMIDTLMTHLPNSRPSKELDGRLDFTKKYGLLTLHRPSNVDDVNHLLQLLEEICTSLHDVQVLFPVHPRTQKKLSETSGLPKNLILAPPLPYLEFIHLLKNAWLVITDSGGIQEETTYLSIPCLTMRQNTERPETISIGSNILIGDNIDLMKEQIESLRTGQWKQSQVPPLWDGQTASRILKYFLQSSYID